MKVEVYRNLNNGKLSIRCFKTKHIVGHAFKVILMDGYTKVSEKGRQRVLEERQKNVHAFVVGDIADVVGFTPYKGRRLPQLRALESFLLDPKYSVLYYNPYKTEVFVDSLGEPAKDKYHKIVIEVAENEKVEIVAFY